MGYFMHPEKFWFLRLEPEPNQNNRNQNSSIPTSEKELIGSYFLGQNFQKNRGTECPALPTHTHTHIGLGIINRGPKTEPKRQEPRPKRQKPKCSVSSSVLASR